VDQRRFIAFLMLSLAVLVTSSLLFPPQQPPPAPPDGQQPEQPVAGAPAQPGEQPEQPQPEQPGAQPEARPLAQLIPPAAAAAASTQFVTLGSIDPNSGYRMLATLTNRGAAVERVEMSSPRFLDLDNRSGYLGRLAPRDVEGGIEVRVVGPGTPAAQAGLQAQDVIVGIGDAASAEPLTVESFEAQLAKTRPGRQITLQVRRGAAAPQTMTAKLARRPLAVIRPEIENVEMRGAEPPEGYTSPPSFLMTLSSLAGKPVVDEDAKRLAEWLEDGAWEITDRDETGVTFRLALPELHLELLKRYTLEPVPPDSRDDPTYPGYHLRFDIEVRNTSDVAQKGLAYRLDGPNGLPIEGWWYAYKISQRWFSGAGLRDVVVRFAGSKEAQVDCSRIAQGKAETMGQGNSLAYVGVDAQYFSAVLIPNKKSLAEVWFDTTEAKVVGPLPPPEEHTPLTYTNVTCQLTRNTIDIPAGASFRDSFTVFVGPKRPDLLARYYAGGDPNYSLTDLIYYGWFGIVARAMLVVLHFFYGIVGNYGIAIMMLTVLVRGAMFPVSLKQTQNMIRMQELKPEMDRITEKYKTDMQKRSQAMQELYRKHRINPLGGCLPLFIQLPIFIGLYRSLMIDVELRQSSLFGSWIHWCSNLAAPDMLLNWSPIMPDFINDGQGIFGLGPYLNILPLVTVALFLVTQKMAMPPATNEQAAMQQKMMKYMTVFMGLLFYKVASGLCLYFIASSVWGIAERKLLAKTKHRSEALAAAGPADGKSPKDTGSKPPQNGSPGQRKQSKPKRKR
jgi:YidC/Oxa1 family membrane protein insertase